MRSPESVVRTLRDRRVVAVVRLPSGDAIREVADSLVAGGVSCIEVTMTVPKAIRYIEVLSAEYPEVLVGAGTVMTAQQAEECIAAEAQFIVSPTFVPEVVTAAALQGVAVVPGALTPTEVVCAWQAGASMVKIFPAARVGPKYLSDLKGPLPDIPLLPTGGITDQNILEYIQAGADAVCVGSWLVCPNAVRDGDFALIAGRARRLLQRLEEGDIGHEAGEGA